MSITTIIPTSPIPSHPSVEIIEETIFNTRKYTDGQIVIMFDGVHGSLEHRTADYNTYKREMLKNISEEKYGNCIPVIFNEHSHQSLMIRVVLNNFVKTNLIMFTEHDCSAIGEIPFDDICALVSCSQEINYIRFHIFDKLLKEHAYLLLDKKPITVRGIPLVRTLQFSARPHIAKTEWYRQILKRYFKSDYKGMIEDVIHGIVPSKYEEYKMDIFGLAIYTPEGNLLRSYHSDGRGDDEKIIEG